MAQLDTLFRAMQEHGASDLHLVTGNPPIMRITGDLVRLSVPESSDATLRPLLQEMTPPARWDTFAESDDVDFGYDLNGVARFRRSIG